jgi:hypothetical protein
MRRTVGAPEAYDPEFEPTTAERIARNDAIFREANERIREAAEEHGAWGEYLPVICECADPACREILRVLPEEYAAVRENPAWFLNATGHQVVAGRHVEVVRRGGGHVVVEKVGRAGEVARELADGGHELSVRDARD